MSENSLVYKVMSTLVSLIVSSMVALLKAIFKKKPAVVKLKGLTTFTFYCPKCYRTFTTKCFYGRKVKCYGCGNVMDVPDH